MSDPILPQSKPCLQPRTLAWCELSHDGVMWSGSEPVPEQPKPARTSWRGKASLFSLLALAICGRYRFAEETAMRNYSREVIFSKDELRLLESAIDLLERVPNGVFKNHGDTGDLLRCHELARAFGRVLGLKVQDGKVGPIEHSWLWTKDPAYALLVPIKEPTLGSHNFALRANILDVYAPGKLPQVQLIHSAPEVAPDYIPSPEPRDDIDEENRSISR